MRTHEEYQQILTYAQHGYSPTYISRLMNIPRRTIADCINRYGSLEHYEATLEKKPTAVLLEILQEKRDDPNCMRKAYAYILGIYLGDGHISKVRNVYRIRISLDARYPNLIRYCADRLQELLPENQVGIIEIHNRGHLSCVSVTAYYGEWCTIIPQHGEGLKHDRPIILEEWQQKIIEAYPLEFFRRLYHSDGSRFINRVKGYEYPRYQFTNRSIDIIRLFTSTCDRLNLQWKAKTRSSRAGGTHDIFISRRADVAFLDQHIGPKS